MNFFKSSLTAFLIFISLASAQSQTTPAEIFQKGLEAYYNAKFDDGIRFFDEYIKISPTDTRGFTYRGLCNQGKKNFPQAIQDFSSVITMAPSSSDGYIYRGNTYTMMKNYSSAESDFNNAIKYDPNNVEGFIGLSNCYIAMSKFKRADKVLSSALATDPKNARLYINKAYINILENDTMKIIDNISSAMYYDSNVVFTNHSRELLQLKLEGYKNALKIVDQKIKNNPYSPMAYFSRGLVYFFMNSYEKATSDFNKAEELYSDKNVKMDSLMDQIERSINRNSNVKK